MSPQELIDSGILEMYCLGIATEEEKILVESLVISHPELKSELAEINNVLVSYATKFAGQSKIDLKKKLFEPIANEISMSKILSRESSVEEWLQYLKQLNLEIPMQVNGISIHELPDSNYLTMALFAESGAEIPNEEHHEVDEHFLICSGSCEMIVDGEKTIYKEGDYFCIHPYQIHSGVVLSGDPMIMIVQRRAA